MEPPDLHGSRIPDSPDSGQYDRQKRKQDHLVSFCREKGHHLLLFIVKQNEIFGENLDSFLRSLV